MQKFHLYLKTVKNLLHPIIDQCRTERIMYNRLYSYLTENNILLNKQLGFRAGHSTEHALLELVDQISNTFNDKNYLLGMFIDLLKYFDTVGHKILIRKLEH